MSVKVQCYRPRAATSDLPGSRQHLLGIPGRSLSQLRAEFPRPRLRVLRLRAKPRVGWATALGFRRSPPVGVAGNLAGERGLPETYVWELGVGIGLLEEMSQR